MMVELPEQHISPPLHHVPNVYNKCTADKSRLQIPSKTKVILGVGVGVGGVVVLLLL